MQDPTQWATVEFQPRGSVRWFNPKGLMYTGFQVLLAGIFGRYADKREIQRVFASRGYDLSERSELWIDYVADLGDGFAPTYAIASLLARDRLTFESQEGSIITKRGDLLVLGGDQVYPVASEESYDDRFIGPYATALPAAAGEEAPYLFAIPGNHDWYDGLTTFLRLFCTERLIGAWRTVQARSYFALELPHGWWLWGIDVAFDWFIDEPQLDYFRGVADRLSEGDRIILATAKPSWIHAALTGDYSYASRNKAVRNLEQVEREIIGDRADVVLALSGDLHHYSRYAEPEGRQRITCGGGGAFLYPTHRLAPDLVWPASDDLPGAERRTYERRSVFPDYRTSRSYVLQTLKLPIRNWKMTMLTGLTYLAFAWIAQGRLPGTERTVAFASRDATMAEIATALVRSPLAILLAVLLVIGLYGFADSPRRLGKALMGSLHWVAHIGLVMGVIWIASHVTPLGHLWFTAIYLALVFLGGAAAGSLCLGLYLAMSQAAGRHPTEAYAAQRIEDHKSFLRMHIDASGRLTLYAVGLGSTPGWDRERAAEPGRWRVRLKDRPEPRLVEQPVGGGVLGPSVR